MRMPKLTLAYLLLALAAVVAPLSPLWPDARADITVGSPPARPALNQFAITAVHISAGSIDADVVVRTGTTPVKTYTVQVRPGSCIGLRYAASGGDVEGYTRTDASITIAGAFGAFATTAGTFAARAAALETWLQGGGRLCLPQ